MILIKKAVHLLARLQHARNQQNTVGFVPTMGALHAGHLSLLEAARAGNTLTVVSIFVNPAQFNDKNDFERYPVTIEKDLEWLAAAGCDIVFLPSVSEIYPLGYDEPAVYDLGFLETVLEGRYRPGHFQGVCKVMHRLLDLVQADNLYMGQKDYQQCMVVNRLLSLIESRTVLHTCPTLREPDGLAMSSRNTRLSPEEREKAPAIFAALQLLWKRLAPGSLDAVMAAAHELLLSNDFRVDYVSIADAHTLAPVDNWDGRQSLVALAAAFQHDVRLIDNLVL